MNTQKKGKRNALVLSLLSLQVLCFSSLTTYATPTNSLTQTTTSSELTSACCMRTTRSALNSALTTSTFEATEDQVKVLGRTYYYNDALWLVQSASGIEFDFHGDYAELTFEGDSVATDPNNEINHPRIAIYVNNKLVIDDRINSAEKTYKIFQSDTPEDVNVRVVKLSEASVSLVGISSITVNSSDGIQPVQPRSRKIEFIGDSITCGYGVDALTGFASFTTATEDATKSYGYQTAQALDADYSFDCFSGYGVVSGYNPAGKDLPNYDWLLPTYYDKVGTSAGLINNELQISSIPWQFDVFQPDVIVINLGTNDNLTYGTDDAKKATFVAGYVDFLKQVRSYNPDATIICTLGMMGDNLYSCIETAVTNYTTETADTNVSCMNFDVPKWYEGHGAVWHPSRTTHTKAAKKLTAYIQEIKNW